MRITSSRSAYLVLLAFLVATACGGGSSSPTGPSTPTPMPTPTPTPTPTPSPQSSGYIFTSEGLRSGLAGAQPYALVFNGSTLLYINGNSGTVYQSSDGLNFTGVQSNYPGGGSYSIVALSGGRLRMYYLNQQTGAVGSATSTDAINWATESGTRIQLNTFAVPRVVAIPGSGFRMYYNQPATSGGVMLSARSDDGLTFTQEGGERLSSPGVTWADPAVIAVAGGWLMATSQIPNANPATRAQEIYLATSSDGLTWAVDSQPLITNAARQVADPAFADLGGGRYRIYFNSLNGPPPQANSANFVGSGVIARGPNVALAITAAGTRQSVVTPSGLPLQPGAHAIRPN